MSLLLLPLAYIFWHYTRAWTDLWRLTTNYLWFFYHFFSIPLLLGTFFAPWKRLSDGGKSKAMGGGFGRLIFNLMLRIVGVFARGAVVGIGIFSLAFAVLCFFLLFAVWLVMPVLLVILFVSGLQGLLTL